MCFALVTAIVLLLPIPVRLNITLQGFRFIDTPDTVTDSSVNMSIKGWQLIYLFRPNKIKGTLTIAPYDFEKSNNAVYEFMGPTLTPSDDIILSSLTRYSATKNRYTPGYLYFSKNFENVMVTESENSEHFYIATVKTNYELNDLLNYFEGHIPMLEKKNE